MGCSVPGKKKNHSTTSATKTGGKSQSTNAISASVVIVAPGLMSDNIFTQERVRQQYHLGVGLPASV
jgi:hypothetical protein